MEISCPQCGYSVQMEDGKVPEREVRTSCPRCQATFLFSKSLKNTSPDSIRETFHCPKCNTEQERGDVCVHCGLIFEKYYQMSSSIPVEPVLENQPKQQPPDDFPPRLQNNVQREQEIATTQQVPIGKYLWIFAASYVVLMIVASLVLNFLNILRGTGVNTGVFIGTAIFTLSKFAKDHGRLWNVNEKWRIIIGLLFISMVYDLLVALVAVPNKWDTKTFIFAIGFAVAFISVLRFIGLWIFMGPMAKTVFGISTKSDT